jgi:hypothetical protein
VKVKAKVFGYNMLICAGIACGGAVTTAFWGPSAGLLYLAAVACAVPLGKVLWP